MYDTNVKFGTAFGLAFDVERDPNRLSGFRPAETDLGVRKALFGDLRLEGFAAMLRLGFAEKLIIIGGNEKRYENEAEPVNRAYAIVQMLVHDHDNEPDRVTHIASKSNTSGNITALVQIMSKNGLDPGTCGVVSSHYHLPRAEFDLREAGVLVRTFPAEAFILLEGRHHLKWLIKRFGGGPLAERSAYEIKGLGDKITGNYQPLTNTKA